VSDTPWLVMIFSGLGSPFSPPYYDYNPTRYTTVTIAAPILLGAQEVYAYCKLKLRFSACDFVMSGATPMP
jgi:hypothetical protein